MNEKEYLLNQVAKIVVECCATQIDDKGTMSVTMDQLKGKCRKENVILTRCIFASIVRVSGWTVTTIGEFLGITPNGVRNLLKSAQDLHQTNRIYRIAEAEATLKCRDIIPDGL